MCIRDSFVSGSPEGNDVQLTQTITLRGFRFAPMTVREIVAHMSSSWDAHRQVTYAYQNLHTMFLQTTNGELAAAYESGLPIVDGLPIVAMLRAAGHDVTREHRVTGVDLLHPVLRQAEKDNTNVFIVGQREPVLRCLLYTSPSPRDRG